MSSSKPRQSSFSRFIRTHVGGLVALRRLRNLRASAAYVHDVFMMTLAFVIALDLQSGGPFLIAFEPPVWKGILSYALVSAAAFSFTRQYRGLWRYASLPDMVSIAKSVTLATMFFIPLYVLSADLSKLPIEVLAVSWFISSIMLGAPRMVARLTVDHRNTPDTGSEKNTVPLLLAGAGGGTELFLRALARDRQSPLRVVGIVDEMGTHLRSSIHGVEVLGAIDDLARVVEKLDRRGDRPERLVLTEDSLSPVAVRSLLEEAVSLGLTLSRIPRLTELRSGIGDRVEVKPVAIEDLLGRPQAVLDRESMAALVRDARVIVTGAGGSIGSELVRQISDFGPSEITLMDNSELHLYDIDMELGARHPSMIRHTVMADVRDQVRVREVFVELKPDLVFHAAAMKHVPLVELNPCEGVLTNVVGTRNIADACVEFGVTAMVLISTDKAVNPTNVMGAAKRIAESYCQALDIQSVQRHGGQTRFFTVRFGNVLGSTGSVVPLFQRQLAAGGPITVTHPHVTRYFMTIAEAVELVLQASALGSNTTDTSGTIFVLEMGEPVRIQDLARQMIRLAGLRYGRDIDIVYTGLRAGEKLYEEPLHASEELQSTKVRGILLAAPRTADYAMLCRLIDELSKAARASKRDKTLSLVQRLVPEYEPTENTDGGLGDVDPDAFDIVAGVGSGISADLPQVSGA
jgi:FlaA1/EpsC-like NDP-sugar epimerase